MFPLQVNQPEDLIEMIDRGHPALEERETVEEREGVVEGEEEVGRSHKDQSSLAEGEIKTG